MFLKELTSFIAALMFAVHPIHTEAVGSKMNIFKQGIFVRIAKHNLAYEMTTVKFSRGGNFGIFCAFVFAKLPPKENKTHMPLWRK